MRGYRLGGHHSQVRHIGGGGSYITFTSPSSVWNCVLLLGLELVFEFSIQVGDSGTLGSPVVSNCCFAFGLVEKLPLWCVNRNKVDSFAFKMCLLAGIPSGGILIIPRNRRYDLFNSHVFVH